MPHEYLPNYKTREVKMVIVKIGFRKIFITGALEINETAK